MKIGVVGFDTDHAHIFPAYFREMASKNSKYKEIEVVAGWPGDPSSAVHPEQLDKMQKKSITSMN